MAAGARWSVEHRDRIIVHVPLDVFDGPEGDLGPVVNPVQRHANEYDKVVEPSSRNESPVVRAPGGGYAAQYQSRVEHLGSRGQSRQVRQPQAAHPTQPATVQGGFESLASVGLYDSGPETATSRWPIQVDNSPEHYPRPTPTSPYWRRISASEKYSGDNRSPPAQQCQRHLRAPSGCDGACHDQYGQSWELPDDRYHSPAGITGRQCDQYEADGGSFREGACNPDVIDRLVSGGRQETGMGYNEVLQIEREAAIKAGRPNDCRHTPRISRYRGEAAPPCREEEGSHSGRTPNKHNAQGDTTCYDGGEYKAGRYPINGSFYRSDTHQNRRRNRGDVESGDDSVAPTVVSTPPVDRDGFQEQQVPLSGHTRQLPSSSEERQSPSKSPLTVEQQKKSSFLGQQQYRPHRDGASGGDGLPSSSVRRQWRKPSSPEKQKPKPEERNEALVKTPSDMLLFSKKARPVEYIPCTLKEYRETKPKAYVELGKLQPDLHTDELIAKRANAERVREFSTNLRQINCENAAARRSPRLSTKGRAQDARSRALEFARRIPLPRKRRPVNPPLQQQHKGDSRGGGGGYGGGEGELGVTGGIDRELTELEALEALHFDMRRKVQAARSTFGA